MPFHPSDIICLSTLFIFPMQTIKYQCMPTSKYIINHTENVMFHWLYASINVFVHHFQVSLDHFSPNHVDFARIYWLRIDTSFWGAHSAYLNLSNFETWCRSKWKIIWINYFMPSENVHQILKITYFGTRLSIQHQINSISYYSNNHLDEIVDNPTNTMVHIMIDIIQ